MIIDNSYFIDEIYIPHAKPSITDDVTAIAEDMANFIDVYEKEALLKCLGYPLYKEFTSQLDSTQTNGLKPSTDEKWDKLLNGTEYTDPEGNLTFWAGIRTKKLDVYCKSFLADYVYYFYEQSSDDSRVGVGNVQEEASNAVRVQKTPKVVAAWRRFFAAVQGGQMFPAIYAKSFGVGIDWIGSSTDKTLYGFINDSNILEPDTYKDFKPFSFTNMNQFGI